MDNKTTNIENGFNNILIMASEVAKMYGVNYTPEQINQAKTSYTNMVNQKLESMGYVAPTVTPETAPNVNAQAPVQEERPMQMVYAQNNDNLRKAGFADIFILSIIVLVYAAIIVNLILKLR